MESRHFTELMGQVELWMIEDHGGIKWIESASPTYNIRYFVGVGADYCVSV